MSGVATEFTAAAAARLDDYLSQVRTALTGTDLDPADVEADIREHVAVEFASHTRPVALVELEKVLAALGPPAGWAPAPPPRPGISFRPWGLLAGLRRRVLGVVGTLLHGPEDWRLAYLCLLLTVLAIPSVGILLVPAYLVARAAIALAAERNEPLGARAWLVYPPVALVSGAVLLALCVWPVSLIPLTMIHAVEPAEWYRANVAEVREDGRVVYRAGRPPEPAYRSHTSGVYRGRDGVMRIDPSTARQHELVLRALDHTPLRAPGLLAVFAALGGFLLWGLVLGLLWWQFPRTAAAVFFPLLPAAGGAKLAVVCGAGFIVWVGFACRLVDAGG